MNEELDQVAELRKTLQVAHDAFQRERSARDAAEFEVSRLTRILETERVEREQIAQDLRLVIEELTSRGVLRTKLRAFREGITNRRNRHGH